MLAVALLATISVITWGTVSTSFRLRAATLDKFERYRVLQNAMNRMTREISMAFITSPEVSESKVCGDQVYQTTFEGDDDELTFTSLAHVRVRSDDTASEQAEISYRVENSPGLDGKMHRNLIRREDAPIDARVDRGGVRYVLVEDVEDVTFEYWDGTREIAGDAWVREWKAKDRENILPSRVRITIKVKHPTRQDRTVEIATQTTLSMLEPIDLIKLTEAQKQSQQRDEDRQRIESEGLRQLGDLAREGGLIK
jgi:hypothetical protein